MNRLGKFLSLVLVLSTGFTVVEVNAAKRSADAISVGDANNIAQYFNPQGGLKRGQKNNFVTAFAALDFDAQQDVIVAFLGAAKAAQGHIKPNPVVPPVVVAASAPAVVAAPAPAPAVVVAPAPSLDALTGSAQASGLATFLVRDEESDSDTSSVASYGSSSSEEDLAQEGDQALAAAGSPTVARTAPAGRVRVIAQRLLPVAKSMALALVGAAVASEIPTGSIAVAYALPAVGAAAGAAVEYAWNNRSEVQGYVYAMQDGARQACERAIQLAKARLAKMADSSNAQ
jgi:hypothetical protein